jgi:hypothetical protein
MLISVCCTTATPPPPPQSQSHYTLTLGSARCKYFLRRVRCDNGRCRLLVQDKNAGQSTLYFTTLSNIRMRFIGIHTKGFVKSISF